MSVPDRLLIRDAHGGIHELTREEWFRLLWDRAPEWGLNGVHEGTVLSEEAHLRGHETESWVLDSAQAPSQRDWIGRERHVHAEVYFDSLSGAQEARKWMSTELGLEVQGPLEEAAKDWNAEWKRHFDGIEVAPYFSVVPVWRAEETTPTPYRRMVLNPGAGFGTGTHETTQLCLAAIGDWAADGWLARKRFLDFGSGSGVLGIGAVLAGARAGIGVELDALAIENAQENRALNDLTPDHLEYFEALPEAGSWAQVKFDLVIANILRPVLEEFAQALVSRLERGGRLVLSGLVESDVPKVVERYAETLGERGYTHSVHTQGEWRAIRWFERATEIKA